VIRFKLAEMIEKKQFSEGRRVTISEIANATELNRMTLSKILNQRGYGTGTETIDRLCTYFGCRVEDLMEHVPAGPKGTLRK
jgi:DNA-binding Xre family transcriptional regulator